MRILGNILWFLFGGIFSGFMWWITGALWCCTIVGIPIGAQCFKFACVSFWPFGKEIVYSGGAVSFLVNILWFFFGGMEMALMNLIIGALWCCTIVGVPFGLQFFKLAKLSLAPFGAQIVHLP